MLILFLGVTFENVYRMTMMGGLLGYGCSLSSSSW